MNEIEEMLVFFLYKSETMGRREGHSLLFKGGGVESGDLEKYKKW